MMKQVTIVLRTRQTVEGETAEFSQHAAGTLEATENGFLLRYAEQDENGLTTDNTFLLSDTHGYLKRTGAVKSEMRFRPDADSVFPYHTFYGTFDFTLHTEYFRHTLSENGGKVMIRYSLSAQGQIVGDYTLKLNITEKDD